MIQINSRAYEDNDNEIRKQILNISNRECINERLFLSFCIENQSEIYPLKKYPYIVDFEYEIRIKGEIKGEIDLFLTDGKEYFLNVEVKYLPLESGKRNRKLTDSKRTKVYNQATRNEELLKKIYPDAQIGCFALTNELLKNNDLLADKFKEFKKEKKAIWAKRKKTLYPAKKAKRVILGQ